MTEKSHKDKETTKEWLENILDGYYKLSNEKNPKLEVLDWTIGEACKDSESHLSELLALDISFTVDGDEQRLMLVAKLLPTDTFNRTFVIENQFDLREIKFYLEVVPILETIQRTKLPKEQQNGLAVPKCYHAVYKAQAESILVLSDLRHEGYSLAPLSTGLTRGQVNSAIKCLASFHALSYSLTVKEKDINERFPYLLSVAQTVDAFQHLVERGMPQLLKFLDGKADHTKIVEALKSYTKSKVSETFLRILSESKNMNTLIHVDFWCNNLMFKEKEGNVSCKILDWQMLAYGSPAVDLAMILSTSLPTDLRQNEQKDIIHFYYENLTKECKKLGVADLNYSVEDLQEDVKSSQAYAALLIVGSIDMALGNGIREQRVVALLNDLVEQEVF